METGFDFRGFSIDRRCLTEFPKVPYRRRELKMSADNSANCNHPRQTGQALIPDQGVLFRMVGTHHDGQLIRIRQSKFTVGSSLGCTLSLRSPHVHPLHALLLRGKRGLLFRAMASDTRVNGVAVSEVWLSEGDQISLGAIDLELLETGSTFDEPELSEQGSTVSRLQTLSRDSFSDLDSTNDIRLREHQRIRQLLAELRTTRQQLNRALHNEKFETSESFRSPALEETPLAQKYPAPLTIESSPERKERLPDLTLRPEDMEQNRNVVPRAKTTEQQSAALNPNETGEEAPSVQAATHSIQWEQEALSSFNPSTDALEPDRSSPSGADSDYETYKACKSKSAARSDAAPSEIDAKSSTLERQKPSHTFSEKDPKRELQQTELTNHHHGKTVVEKTEALLKSTFEGQLHTSATVVSDFSSLSRTELDASKNLSSLREVANLSARETMKRRINRQPPMLKLIAAGASSTAMGVMLGVTSISLMGGVVFVGLGVALLGAAVATKASSIIRAA